MRNSPRQYSVRLWPYKFRHPKIGFGEAGFSIIELLVSMVLLALLLSLMPSALRLAMRASLVREQLDVVNAQGAALDFLAGRLEVARPIFVLRDRSRPDNFFDGRHDALSFLAPLPDAAPINGLYRIKVHVVDGVARVGTNTKVLAIDLLPYLVQEDSFTRQTRKPIRHSIHKDVVSFSIEYFGAQKETDYDLAWQREWRGRSDLPKLVELTIRTGKPGSLKRTRIVVEPRLRRRS